MKWTYELKQFAAERGLEGVFAKMISVEEELQKAVINTKLRTSLSLLIYTVLVCMRAMLHVIFC